MALISFTIVIISVIFIVILCWWGTPGLLFLFSRLISIISCSCVFVTFTFIPVFVLALLWTCTSAKEIQTACELSRKYCWVAFTWTDFTTLLKSEYPYSMLGNKQAIETYCPKTFIWIKPLDSIHRCRTHYLLEQHNEQNHKNILLEYSVPFTWMVTL